MNPFLQAFPIFLLIFCRMTAFFVVAPIFSSRSVPMPFRIGLSFFISLIVYLTYGIGQTAPIDAGYPLLVIKEILAGLLIGFIAYLFFSIVQIAGVFIDFMIGLTMANIVDPMTGVSAPLTGNFKFYVLIVVFLAMNGHHHLLTALMTSYDWIPVVDDRLFASFQSGTVTEFLTRTFATVFMLALQLSAPIVVALFLTDVGLGFLAKTAPQFNVFVIGIPIKIIVGLVLLAFTLTGLTTLFGNLFDALFRAMGELYVIVSGGS